MASPSKSSVLFAEGKMWMESLLSALKDSPHIIKKIEEFKAVKEANPLALFGSNDKSFASNGIYKQYLPKALKAHLTSDISIVYELSGRNPTTITLLGVFTHADLGTGQPANPKIQKNMAKRLAKEDIENYLASLLS